MYQTLIEEKREKIENLRYCAVCRITITRDGRGISRINGNLLFCEQCIDYSQDDDLHIEDEFQMMKLQKLFEEVCTSHATMYADEA